MGKRPVGIRATREALINRLKEKKKEYGGGGSGGVILIYRNFFKLD